MIQKRTPVIAGNWKMNLTAPEAVELVNGIRYGLAYPGEVDVIVAPTFLCLPEVARVLDGSYIAVSAQDLFYEDKGAYTGQCSGKMLKAAGADYAIIGHSERRQYFGETDETVNKKVKAALRNDLAPIVCIGETLDERENGLLEEVIQRQVRMGLDGFAGEVIGDLIIAYEPVWAIGTGKTATPDQAEEVHRLIRSLVSGHWGEIAADKTRILYGGSVKPANSKELLSLPNVDGALVGGAALKAPDFIEIIKSA